MKKFGIWLHNHTDNQDDEWIYFYAKNLKKAKEKIKNIDYDETRFRLDTNVMPVKKFRRFYGLEEGI